VSILRTQRRSQPQQPVTVDLPYSKANLCVNYAVGNRNLIDGTGPSSRVGIGTQTISPLGVCKTGYDGLANAAADVYSVPSTSVFTLICVYDLSGSSGSYSPIIGGDQTGNRQFQLRFTPSNTIEFIRFNTVVSTFTATTTTTGRTGCVVAVSDGASVRLIHKGIVSSTATITGTPKPLTVVAPGGYLGFDQQPLVGDKGVAMCAVLPFALSNAEGVALSLNPWQLFTPIQRSIWVPAAAGGPTYTLTAASGSFALTGQTTGLAFNRKLAAASGSFALTGNAATLAFNRKLAAASGSFALTGSAATLAFNRKLVAASGAFALTGNTTTLAFNRKLAAASGSFAETGNTATLASNRALAAASGSFALTGNAADLTYTPISGATYTLAASSGGFTLTGIATTLAFNRAMVAASGAYTASGAVSTLAFNRRLSGDSGAFALTGSAAALTAARKLTAASGSYALSGQAATLTYTPISSATYTLAAGSGSFTLTGIATSLAFNRAMIAASGTFALTGQATTLTYTPAGGPAVYPNPSFVLAGVSYGPTGAEYTGTFVSPSAASIAAQVRTELAAELLRITEVAKIHGLVQGVNLVVTPTSRTAGDIAQTISGDGVSSSTVSRA
jgi:hypothetical protein